MGVFRILTIDGGGIKGVFPASFLATVEDTINNKIGNYFDLIVGTSTGGIIALGLGLGFSAKELLEFYEKLGPLVFSGNPFICFLRQLGFSKYDQGPLKEALTKRFGEHKLGESKNRLVIPSFNLETGEVHVYKTSHHLRLMRDYKEKVTDVALATAAAPTYFPTQRSISGVPLIDGGIWANNPVGFAVVEAIGILGWPRESLRILSIGCTATAVDVSSARLVPRGMIYWSTKIVEVFMSGQSSASIGIAQLLAGHENLVRINPVVPKNRFGLDKINEIGSLKGLGDSEARKAIPALKDKFFCSQVEEFKPVYRL